MIMYFHEYVANSFIFRCKCNYLFRTPRSLQTREQESARGAVRGGCGLWRWQGETALVNRGGSLRLCHVIRWVGQGWINFSLMYYERCKYWLPTGKFWQLHRWEKNVTPSTDISLSPTALPTCKLKCSGREKNRHFELFTRVGDCKWNYLD